MFYPKTISHLLSKHEITVDGLKIQTNESALKKKTSQKCTLERHWAWHTDVTSNFRNLNFYG